MTTAWFAVYSFSINEVFSFHPELFIIVIIEWSPKPLYNLYCIVIWGYYIFLFFFSVSLTNPAYFSGNCGISEMDLQWSHIPLEPFLCIAIEIVLVQSFAQFSVRHIFFWTFKRFKYFSLIHGLPFYILMSSWHTLDKVYSCQSPVA